MLNSSYPTFLLLPLFPFAPYILKEQLDPKQADSGIVNSIQDSGKMFFSTNPKIAQPTFLTMGLVFGKVWLLMHVCLN
jgi:hypothetical protein